MQLINNNAKINKINSTRYDYYKYMFFEGAL